MKKAAGSVASVALVGMLMMASGAHAEGNYGCACVHNRTNNQVNYSYRWGEADWRKIALNANYTMAHCWRYENGQHSSPNLQISLDIDLGPETTMKTYDLPRGQAVNNVCNAEISNNFWFDISYVQGSGEHFIHVTHR